MPFDLAFDLWWTDLLRHSVVPILLLIARSKLVPDFALTIHFLNLLVTTLYTRALPTNVYWWFVQACSVGLMVSLGIWACRWRELKPMAFGGTSSKGREKGLAEAGNGFVKGEEEGEGHVMGKGGRGGDGAGAYEMVGMAREAG